MLSSQGMNKKVYMLYELTPAEEVTDGTWYRGHDMDTVFVGLMRDACLRVLRGRGPQTAEQVWALSQEMKLSTVELSVRDIETVLSSLQMDRLVEIVSPMRLASEKLREEHMERAAARRKRQQEREDRRKRRRQQIMNRRVRSIPADAY